MTYDLHTVPSPRDVLEHPLSLFCNSVLSRDPVLQYMDQSNYKSYIAAVAKEIHKHRVCDGCDVQYAELNNVKKVAQDLAKIIDVTGIKMDLTSKMLLKECCLKLDTCRIEDDKFASSFGMFAKSVI